MSYMRQSEALYLSDFVKQIKTQVLSLKTDETGQIKEIIKSLESLENTLFYKHIPRY